MQFVGLSKLLFFLLFEGAGLFNVFDRQLVEVLLSSHLLKDLHPTLEEATACDKDWG